MTAAQYQAGWLAFSLLATMTFFLMIVIFAVRQFSDSRSLSQITCAKRV